MGLPCEPAVPTTMWDAPERRPMAVARHGSGPTATARAFASQVHPVFMLPAIAAGAFGAVLATPFSWLRLGVHLAAVFAALYTAHVKDGYVDFHRRDEDDDHPMTGRGCRVALAGSSALFALALVGIVTLVDPWAGLLTLPGWVIGYHHAPTLDTNPVTATSGYPAGIAFALLSGYYVQAGSLSVAPIAYATVFLVVLSGIKVVDDAQDHEYDRSVGKRTVAVVLGRSRARAAAYALMGAGMLGVVVLAGVDVFPPSSVFAVVAFAAVAGLARRANAEVATMLLIRGSYLFLAALVAGVWFRPLG